MTAKVVMPKIHASIILNKWRFTEPSQIDPELIAEELNLHVKRKPLHGSVARLIPGQNHSIIVVHDSISEVGRERFAIAHEIGHHQLHRQKHALPICTDESFSKWYNESNLETQANIFAAELLMPEHLFINSTISTTPTFEEIDRLCYIFQVSLTSCAIRYIQLSNYPCALISAKHGKILWHTKSQYFSYWLKDKGSPMSHASVAWTSQHTGLSNLGENVHGSVWLENIGDTETIFLFEQVKSLKRYDTTLSLITPL